MVQIISKGKEPVWLDNQQVSIISDALMHEMERYNQAYSLVCDEHASASIEEAKGRVYDVFIKVISFLQDEEA